MKPVSYLIFKANRKKYFVKSSNIVDVIANPGIRNKNKILESKVKYNGKVVPIVNINKTIDDPECNGNLSNLLILEIEIGRSKEFVGIAMEEVIESVAFDSILGFTPINSAEIENNRKAAQSSILYKGERIHYFNTHDVTAQHFIDASLNNLYSLTS